MERTVPGYCAGVDVLRDCFEKDSMLHGDPGRHEQINAILRVLRDDCVDWLGEKQIHARLEDHPPVSIYIHKCQRTVRIFPVPLRCWLNGST